MAGAGRRSLCDSSFSSLRLACIAAFLLASAAFSSAKPSTHKRLPLEAEAFTPTGPYLTHSAADCPASAQVCLSTGLTFPLMDDKQHGFDPHPKDRPDKYSPITQAFPITITSTEAITGLQFEAVDEDCVRPWLSGMAGQENSLLLQLFWGGQIEFNAPAVFPTEPESMDELPPQKEPALFAIAGVGSAHPPEKQLCITTIRATIGEEAQILTGAPVNCPFDMMRCTPAISTKAETELIPGRLAELYKKAAKLPAEEHNAITRMQSGITELLARVHPDDALVVNQTVAKALLRQEVGPFNKETAQPYTRVLLDWAANATTQAEWAASAPSKKPRAQQQAVRQAAARQAAQQVIAEEDDEDGEAESEDDYGLGFDLEQPALLDVLQQNSGQQAAPFSQQQASRLQPGQRTQELDEDVSAGYGDQDPDPIDETLYLHPFSLDISRRRLLQLAPELDSAASNAEPGLFTSTSSDGVGSIEGDDKLEAMLDSTLAAEGVQLDPVPEGVNAPPTAVPDVTTTPQGLAGEAAGGLEQGIPADTLGSLGTPAPPATLTAITPPAPQIKEDKTDASLGFDDAASSSSADAEETNKQLSETFGSSAADMPTKDLMVNLPASAPVESKKPQEAHQAAMGLTAKSKSSKPLAPGSHAAAPSTTASAAHPPSATSKSSPSTTGGLWGKAKNILGMGGGSRSAAEEEELLEELAEEEEDADMMQSVIASKTGSGSPASSKSKKGGKQSQAEAAEMRERDELLREAEEEVDVGDREGFELGGSILAATETGRVLPASTAGKNGTSGKAAPPSTASSSSLFSSSPPKKGSNGQSQQEMEREVERFEEQEAELEAEMAEMRPHPSASKTGQKGDKAKAAAPASSSSAAGSGKAGSGGKLSSKSSSTSKQDAEDLLLEEASEDYPYLEEDVEIRAADQKASAQQQAAKGVAPSTARKLPPAGGQFTPGGMDISKASPKGLKESLDELRDDLEEDVLEATDAGLPATGAGSALRQPAAPAIKGKTAAAPSSTASKLLGGRKTGEGSQELLEDGNTGLFGAAFGSQGSGSKSATSKGTLAFEEDEEALGLAGGSTATPSKTGSSKLPEAFKEDVTGNDTFRSKASQGILPGAAKQSGEASDTLAGKAGANSSAVKASMDKLADEAETGFEDFASGLGSSSSSSKSSKGLTGSPGSKATSSLSNADTMDEYDEESGFSGGGSKGAGGLSGQSSTKGSSSSPSPTTMAGAASKLLGASSSSSGKTSPAPGKFSAFGQKGGMSSQEESAFDSDADPLSSTGFGQKPTPGSSATSSKGSSALGSLGSYESSSKGSSAFGSNPDLLSSASGLGQKGGTASSGKSSSQLGSDSETELDASSSLAVRDALKSAKDATVSGKGMTGFDGPESIAEMMDEQVKRTPGGSSIRDELAAPSKPSSQSTGQKINGLIFSPGSSTRNLILVSILGAVAGAAAIHYYRILRVSPAQKRIVDLRHFGQPRRGTSSYSRVSNPAAQTWDKDWNDDNWDDASERGFRQKPSR